MRRDSDQAPKGFRPMNRSVIILSGMSGSGKSHYARTRYPTAARISADDFFLQEGKWAFDATKLAEAHAECFREFLRHLTNDEEIIVVDNTNTEVWEISPYVLAARAFGIEAEIITLFVAWNRIDVCATRNVHNVPARIIEMQFDKLIKRALPRYWNARDEKVTL
jgi:NEDD4-binding protein 2